MARRSAAEACLISFQLCPHGEYYDLIFILHYLSQPFAYVCQRLSVSVKKKFEKYSKKCELVPLFTPGCITSPLLSPHNLVKLKATAGCFLHTVCSIDTVVVESTFARMSNVRLFQFCYKILLTDYVDII